MRRPLCALGVALTLTVLAMACSNADTPTSPSATTDTTTTTDTSTAAPPSMTETFTSSLPVSGSRFYSFYVSQRGTVNITLRRIGGTTAVPDSVWVRVGLGKPDATDCLTTTTKDTQSGEEPHISQVLDVGTHCARVADIGNLAVPATFTVTIEHP